MCEQTIVRNFGIFQGRGVQVAAQKADWPSILCELIHTLSHAPLF